MAIFFRRYVWLWIALAVLLAAGYYFFLRQQPKAVTPDTKLMIFPEERALPPQAPLYPEEVGVEALGNFIPEPVELPENKSLKKDSKIYLDPQLQDATGYSNVRKTAVGAEVGVKVTKTSSLGLVSTTEVVDRKDKAAWGEDPETDTTAAVKYKINF